MSRTSFTGNYKIPGVTAGLCRGEGKQSSALPLRLPAWSLPGWSLLSLTTALLCLFLMLHGNEERNLMLKSFPCVSEAAKLCTAPLGGSRGPRDPRDAVWGQHLSVAIFCHLLPSRPQHHPRGCPGALVSPLTPPDGLAAQEPIAPTPCGCAAARGNACRGRGLRLQRRWGLLTLTDTPCSPGRSQRLGGAHLR